MKSFYKSYVRAFVKYAQSSLERIVQIKRITRYAKILNIKANQLLLRASQNKMINLPKLQKEIFETGRDFVRKFSHLLKLNTSKKTDSKENTGNTNEPI